MGFFNQIKLPEDKSEKKISFFKGITYPIDQIVGNLKNFLCLTSVTSLVTSIIFIILGRSNFCAFSGKDILIYCSNNPINMGISAIIFFIGIIYIISRWQLIINGEKDIKQVLLAINWKKDIKIAAFTIIYLTLWVVGLMTAFYLNTRIPNVDWKEELVVFFIGSIIIILCLWGIINAYVIALFLQGRPWLVYKKTFWCVFDNIYKFFAWFLVYTLLFAIIIKDTISIFLGTNVLPMNIANFVGEFCLNFVIYAIVACIISVFNYQANQISED